MAPTLGIPSCSAVEPAAAGGTLFDFGCKALRAIASSQVLSSIFIAAMAIPGLSLTFLANFTNSFTFFSIDHSSFSNVALTLAMSLKSVRASAFSIEVCRCSANAVDGSKLESLFGTSGILAQSCNCPCQSSS